MRRLPKNVYTIAVLGAVFALVVSGHMAAFITLALLVGALALLHV